MKEGEETKDASDLINDAKAKVKDAMENVHLPKMPKVSKPKFMKKKGKKKGETEGADGEEKKEEEGEQPENAEKADTEGVEKVSDEKDKETDASKDETEGKDGEEIEKKTEGEADGEAVEEKKPSVLDSLKALKAPKMPKMPKFGKKDVPSETEQEKEGGEETNEGNDEKKEETDGEKDPEDKEKKDGEGDKEETEDIEEKKTSLMDSLKGMKAPKMPKMPKFNKAKKEDGTDNAELAEEEKKLLEGEEKKDDAEAVEKAENAEEKAKEAEESAPKEKTKAPSLLANLRHVASGLPALFGKKDASKEPDVEAGETDELLEKKEGEGVKMEEIKLDIGEDEKKDEADTKSHTSEKKDPEKGEAAAAAGGGWKELPGRAMAGFFALDQQRRNGLLGVGAGLLLLLLFIVTAAAWPGGWASHHRLVEGGALVETVTACGTIQGHVEGHNRFHFRSVPYSVPVGRFAHSRLPASLAECADFTLANSSTSCLRNTQGGRVGEEDCLVLDVATSSVVYSDPMPVVVYLPGDDDSLRPTTALAYSQGVVWVTVSVRQGVLGFLSTPALAEGQQPPTSGNYGLGDLVTALRWVNINIRHFGGDPGQVTLLGHRQGASLATAVTAVEAADGLYARVWASGGAARLGELSMGAAGEQWAAAVAAVCGDRGRACLEAAAAEELLAHGNQEYWAHDNLPSTGERPMAGWLVVDTSLLTSTVAEAWQSRPVKVPVVIGEIPLVPHSLI